MPSRLPPPGIEWSLLVMKWGPGLCSALAFRMTMLGLSLAVLGFGRGRNLLLRRQGAGGGRPAQGRRHDWVGAKNPRELRGRLESALSPVFVRLGFSGSGNVLSDRLAGPRSISRLLGNFLPASFQLPWKPPAFCTTAFIGCAEGRFQQGSGQNRAAGRWGRVLGVTCLSYFLFFLNPARGSQAFFFCDCRFRHSQDGGTLRRH